jgi:hypothetical protein
LIFRLATSMFQYTNPFSHFMDLAFGAREK